MEEDQSGLTKCFCLEIIDRNDETSNPSAKLSCGCIGHLTCIIHWIRTGLEDRSMIGEQGLSCPWVQACSCYASRNEDSKYYITSDEVESLHRLSESNQSAFPSNELAPLKNDEISKFRRFSKDKFQLEDDELADSNDIDSSDTANCAYIDATTKQCPECSVRSTHYHGHSCHHISPSTGCMNCGTHYCYRCLATKDQNSTLRGNASSCICGSWSTFCKVDDILENIVLRPYPHDMRCGCVICPDCRPGKPCSDLCDGNCVVCKGFINAGPYNLSDDWSPYFKDDSFYTILNEAVQSLQKGDQEVNILHMELSLMKIHHLVRHHHRHIAYCADLFAVVIQTMRNYMVFPNIALIGAKLLRQIGSDAAILSLNSCQILNEILMVHLDDLRIIRNVCATVHRMANDSMESCARPLMKSRIFKAIIIANESGRVRAAESILIGRYSRTALNALLANCVTFVDDSDIEDFLQFCRQKASDSDLDNLIFEVKDTLLSAVKRCHDLVSLIPDECPPKIVAMMRSIVQPEASADGITGETESCKWRVLSEIYHILNSKSLFRAADSWAALHFDISELSTLLAVLLRSVECKQNMLIALFGLKVMHAMIGVSRNNQQHCNSGIIHHFDFNCCSAIKVAVQHHLYSQEIVDVTCLIINRACQESRFLAAKLCSVGICDLLGELVHMHILDIDTVNHICGSIYFLCQFFPSTISQFQVNSVGSLLCDYPTDATMFHEFIIGASLLICKPRAKLDFDDDTDDADEGFSNLPNSGIYREAFQMLGKCLFQWDSPVDSVDIYKLMVNIRMLLNRCWWQGEYCDKPSSLYIGVFVNDAFFLTSLVSIAAYARTTNAWMLLVACCQNIAFLSKATEGFYRATTDKDRDLCKSVIYELLTALQSLIAYGGGLGEMSSKRARMEEGNLKRLEVKDNVHEWISTCEMISALLHSIKIIIFNAPDKRKILLHLLEGHLLSLLHELLVKVLERAPALSNSHSSVYFYLLLHVAELTVQLLEHPQTSSSYIANATGFGNIEPRALLSIAFAVKREGHVHNCSLYLTLKALLSSLPSGLGTVTNCDSITAHATTNANNANPRTTTDAAFILQSSLVGESLAIDGLEMFQEFLIYRHEEVFNRATELLEAVYKVFLSYEHVPSVISKICSIIQLSCVINPSFAVVWGNVGFCELLFHITTANRIEGGSDCPYQRVEEIYATIYSLAVYTPSNFHIFQLLNNLNAESYYHGIFTQEDPSTLAHLVMDGVVFVDREELHCYRSLSSLSNRKFERYYDESPGSSK